MLLARRTGVIGYHWQRPSNAEVACRVTRRSGQRQGVARLARRIGGKDGGSDPGKKSNTGLALTVVVVVVVGAGGGSAVSAATTTGGSASASSSSGARGNPRVGSSDSTAAELRLTRRGLRITGRVANDARDCAAHSYGRVQQFFRRQPCTALHRAQFELHDRNGDVLLVPISWVEMPDEASARNLKELLDTNGAGNITELSRERGRYRAIRYTRVAHASRLSGTVVASAEAQPVARGWTGLALTSIVTTAVQ